jgi:hypothetical protein
MFSKVPTSASRTSRRQTSKQAGSHVDKGTIVRDLELSFCPHTAQNWAFYYESLEWNRRIGELGFLGQLIRC